MKRVAVLLVLILVLGVVGAAAWALTRDDDDSPSGSLGDETSATPSDDESAEPGDARAAPSAAVQRFYDQRPEWEPCGDFECTRIEVPLDYGHPRADRIQLNLLKNPADEPSQRVGALLVNPGGPGAPGTDMAGKSAKNYFRAPLRDSFDLIGFDPRGTGASTPVDCLTNRELDEFVAADPDPDTSAEVTEFVDWTERFGAGCARLSGELAEHVSTYDAARDMDIIRAVLDEPKLNYFGFSYGTKLGSTYAAQFPGRVGRLVLDGAVDISLSFLDASRQQAAGFQTALNAYVDDCVDRGDCYLGDTRAAALSRVEGFVDQVENEPIPVGDRDLTSGLAFLGIITPLYNADYWGFLTQALGDAMEGDAAFLLQLADLYLSRNEDGTYADNSAEAIYAINCLDDPSSLPPSQVPRHYAEFQEASRTFGRVFAWGLTGCRGFDHERGSFDWKFDAAGADPLLVIGTTRDPATPYRWAVALAEQLDSAILVSRDGDGHTGYNSDNECVDEAIEDYLIDGAVPDGDVDCPAE